MPRKRTVPDDVLLDAVLRLARIDGPDAVTFAAVAAETGLAGATLVQRFGTKAAMVRAAMSRAWDHLDADTAAADAVSPIGANGVVELLERLTGQYDAEAFADQLRLLREDLRDPVLRARGETWMDTLSEAIERRLVSRSRDRQRAAGLGVLVLAQWQGTLTVWGFRRHAPLPDAVRAALEALFDRLRIAR